jgi:hypothetical protein
MRELREGNKEVDPRRSKQTIDEEEDTDLMAKLVKSSKECISRHFALIFRCR